MQQELSRSRLRQRQAFWVGLNLLEDVRRLPLEQKVLAFWLAAQTGEVAIVRPVRLLIFAEEYR
jgi:hypothetical protein